MTTEHDASRQRDAKGRWRAGVSGNPGGRPTTSFGDYIRAALAKAHESGKPYAQVISEVMAEKAAGGDLQAAIYLIDREMGRPKQSQEISGPEGGPIQTVQMDVPGG